ncbi:hypothetical protein GCM10027073_57890 [Streptomyces chlorus]|uniref:Uncharacterized protein n=1 Tax=Streptomyces chlorus TaxID=887452 RepID=A0ABW1E9N7_9ACTN
MEQRIGSSSQPQPLEGAGFDPAFIPGLTAPVSGTSDRKADVKDAKGEEEREDTEPASEPEDAAPETDADPATESGKEPATKKEPEAGTASAKATSPSLEKSEAAGSSEAEPVPDGPVFEASDRRAEIVADHSGVRLRLDDQACEFRWDEIGAVETETARFGKRYTVTVHTTERRWYPLEIEATSRGCFATWDTELDAVLDAYFDDGAAEPETSDVDVSDTDVSDANASDAGADAGESKPEAGTDKPKPGAEVDSSDDADEPESDADKDEPESDAGKDKSKPDVASVE